MTNLNPPPWAGAKVSPLEAFNRALGQAVVNMGNALVVELFGTPRQKAAVHAWQERNRLGQTQHAQATTTLESDLATMRRAGTAQRALAHIWLNRHLDTVYADLGLERTR